MHPSRRRKKRPNYGIRTVEVAKGPNGFGFTISGQQPCILSCIVSNSPADQAGLRAGDFLISVNRVSVSKITHDAVVNLIGNSFGPIKMTIAENYYSDSSDEDISFGRAMNTRKPKYPHKPRMYRGYKQDLHKKFAKTKESNYNINNDNYEESACSLKIPNPMEEEGGPIEYKAIVGYLGTIEMPKQLLPNARLQTVCGCIKKLRQEKRKPTAVLMTVLPTCLTLKNSSNHILAIYPTNRVVYISSSMDKESRYFGLVTSAVCDRSVESAQRKCEMSYNNTWDIEKKSNNVEKSDIEVSNSCHVFMTDSKITEHSLHAKKAESFQIMCTNDAITGSCLEFPRNALYIVSLVQNMYRLQSTVEPHRAIEDLVANSPQPSASSNSDSGIGFRDDCGNISDRILLVEFPINRQPPVLHNNNSNRPTNIMVSNIPLESLDLPLNNEVDLNNVRAKFKMNNGEVDRPNLNNIRACEGLSIKNYIDHHSIDLLAKQQNPEMGRLNCRALPVNLGDLEIGTDYSERAVDVPEEKTSVYEEQVDFKSSTDNISMHSARSLDNNTKTPFKIPFVEKKRKHKRAHNLVASCDSLVQSEQYETLLHYKLSPKVYGVSKPNYSCEELSKLEGIEKCGGSLQNLASLWSGHGEKHRGITQSEPDVRIGGGINMCENNGASKFSGEGPASWATSFEKLLECPVGLHTFAEFLKKEFSAENIYFWTACERYRKLNSHNERSAEAQRIYQQHLRIGASEAVNVDSQARQCVEQALKNVPTNLFISPQKHIFNLMKFDSYSRFLKSDLYKQCLAGNSDCVQQLDPNLLLHPASPNKLKKSLSNAEDRRRKSLLPWHRKNRSKSKDRGETDYNTHKHDINENITTEPVQHRNEVHSSKSSLTSLDLAINTTNDLTKLNPDQQPNSARPPLCRVKLVNGSTTVTQIKPTETIAQLVNRLLEKRGITYSCFEVYTDKQNKPLNISESSSLLAGCEVDVEQRVSFRLDLPNKKVIAVKSKCTKLLVEVLRPILHKYSYSLEDVVIKHQGEDVIIDRPVTTVDTLKLTVQLVPTTSAISENEYLPRNAKPPSPTLDEITNKVYEDILQEKAADTSNAKPKSDKGSVKSEDWGSEHSSGLIGRFLKRDSERNRDRKKKLLIRKGNSTHSSIEDISGDQAQGAVSFKKPLIAKLKAGVKLQNTSESEELYEGLSRAQRSRLEDQRGTEINFELPDFLKNKENEQSRKAKNLSEMSKFYTESIASMKSDRIPPIPSVIKGIHSNYENRILLTELSQHLANNNSRLHNYNVYSPNKSVGSNSSSSTPTKALDETVIENTISDSAGEVSQKSEPPPLPPKPKILPIKPSNWKQRDNPRKELYLEQPTSSFV